MGVVFNEDGSLTDEFERILRNVVVRHKKHIYTKSWETEDLKQDGRALAVKLKGKLEVMGESAAAYFVGALRHELLCRDGLHHGYRTEVETKTVSDAFWELKEEAPESDAVSENSGTLEEQKRLALAFLRRKRGGGKKTALQPTIVEMTLDGYTEAQTADALGVKDRVVREALRHFVRTAKARIETKGALI